MSEFFRDIVKQLNDDNTNLATDGSNSSEYSGWRSEDLMSLVLSYLNQRPFNSLGITPYRSLTTTQHQRISRL